PPTPAPPGASRRRVAPAVPADERGRIRFQDLVPPADTLQAISTYLDGRRPIGARVQVQPPIYQGVTVVASLQVGRGVAAGRVQTAALAALYRYFNPLTGGPGGRGGPVGRPVPAGSGRGAGRGEGAGWEE